MEAGAENIRLKMLEEKDATHERTHGRMWDKINDNHTDIEVHKQHSADVFQRLEDDSKDVKEELGTVKTRIGQLVIATLIAAFGLIANLVVMVAEKS